MKTRLNSFIKGLLVGLLLSFLINIPYFVGRINEVNTYRTCEEFNLATDSDIEYCLTAHFYDIDAYTSFTYCNRYESGLKSIKQTFFN